MQSSCWYYLSLFLAFLARFLMAPVYIPNPTWGNHRSIFSDAGFTDIREYQYWDANNRSLDFKGVMDAFNNAPPKSIILLHPCAHNPTGVDPTTQQWIEIAAVCKKRSLIVFFDSAYQGQTFLRTGFASGNLEQDAQAVRHFVNEGLEVLIAQSYSKNFGLYNERCGCLSVVTTSSQKAVEVSSQLCKLIRASYSNPPAFGARVVSLVLNTPALYAEWKIQLESMATRIIFMRKELLKHFLELKTPGTWTHIVSQIGMFSFTGLSTPQVKILKEKYHVYMTDNGRISMAGLNTKNVRRFAEAVDWVVRNVNSPKM
jgi:aspartate aminotransferase